MRRLCSPHFSLPRRLQLKNIRRGRRQAGGSASLGVLGPGVHVDRARRGGGRLSASFRRKASHGSPCARHPASDADTAGGGETTSTTVAAHSPPGTRFPPSGLKPTRLGGDTGGGPAAATARTGAACGEPLPPHPLARAPAAAAPRAPGTRVDVPGDVSGDASGELSRDVSGDVSREPWASRGSGAVGEEAAADAALVERILARPSTYE
eukprot:scaffold9692_cov96-Isochrysis_galbana.AAC.10